MPITRINPPSLHETPGYHHVTIVEGSMRLAFLAGQCPLDETGTLVGPGDPQRQVDQVVANAITALAAAGASPEYVVRSVIYVVTDSRTVLSTTWRRFLDSPLAPAFTSAATLIGVAQLGFPGQIIEVDLTAVSV